MIFSLYNKNYSKGKASLIKSKSNTILDSGMLALWLTVSRIILLAIDRSFLKPEDLCSLYFLNFEKIKFKNDYSKKSIDFKLWKCLKSIKTKK